jgi:hypothetical protein
MIMRLPWWANPWREVRILRGVCDDYRQLTSKMNDEIADVAADNRRLVRERSEAERQLRNLMGAQTPEGALASSAQPDFVLVGIPRGQVGVRLLAARNLAGTRFGMTDAQDPPPRWKIMATLVEPLFIDGQAYPEAMARLQEIWANWDREEAQRRRPQLPGRSSSRGRAAGLSTGPGMLTAGGDDDGKAEPGRA